MVASSHSGRRRRNGFFYSLNRLCGATDWRLPTRNELSGLVHAGLAAGPTIDVIWFPNTANATYWTGENVSSAASFAWGVSSGGGIIFANGKDFSRHVRLVRSGQ